MNKELQPLVEKLNILELGENIELETVHTFTKGLYTRALHIPKGVLLEGKRHRGKSMNMLIKGHMTIYDGKDSYEVHAGFIAESEAFTKKCGYAHEDSIWVNVFPTDVTDLDEIERMYTIPEEEYEALSYKEKQCLST